MGASGKRYGGARIGCRPGSVAAIDELRLYLFGPARLERAGRGVRFDTKKALALLAYLVVEGPQTRDRLADLLWSGQDIDRARGALRRTLSTIRSASGDPELLDAERDHVAVRPERLWVDVLEVRATLEKARSADDTNLEGLERAVGLGRAEVMSGLMLRGAPDFEDWQYRTQERLRKELAGGLGRLVAGHHDAGRTERAIEYARRWVELDPLHEPAHRWLMRLFAAIGDRAAAIEQYRTCVRMLADDLAVTPLQETTELYKSIASGSAAAAPTRRSTDVTERREELPLVGRAGERAALEHLRTALELGHPNATGLREALADLQVILGRYDDALATYQSTLRSMTEPGEKARLERRIGSLLLRRGDSASAVAYLRRAVDLATTPVERSRSLAELALALEDDPDSEGIVAEALRAAEQGDDPVARARAHNVGGLLAARRRDIATARHHLELSSKIAEDLPESSARIAPLNNRALLERDAGDLTTAVSLLEEAIALCERQGDLHRAAALHNNLADVLHAAGRRESSEEHARRAAELFARVGEDPTREPGIWKLVSW